MRRMRRERSGPKPNQTHPRATTTPDIRRAIQASDERTSVLARRYGVSRKTVAKWRGRATTADERMGPKQPLSCISTLEDEAVVLAYRWCTCLSLNESLVRLRRLMPELSRAALFRCLERHGLSKIGRTAKCSPLTSAALKGPYCFVITAIEIGPDAVFADAFPVLLAVEEVTKFVFAEVADLTPENAAAFLAGLVAEFTQRIVLVTTPICPLFTDLEAGSEGNLAAVSSHPFAVVCRTNRIAHMRTLLQRIRPEPQPRKKTFRAVEIR